MRSGWIGLWVAVATASCDAGTSRPGEPPGTTGAASTNTSPAVATATPILADVLRLAGGADRFLVTPRWSPDGRRLLASGRGGVGLWIVDPASGTTRLADPDCRGPAFWSHDGATVACPAGDTTSGWLVHDLAGGIDRVTARPAFVPATIPAGDVPADAEVLFEAEGRRVTYEEYRGRLEAWEGEDHRVLAGEDAAGPRASPDGSRVAWWTGPLLDPTLHVSGLDGREIFAGPGAHAAWLPDGESLVYAVPRAGAGPDGAPRVAASELRLLDLRDASSTDLTATPEAVEMQPAVAPDGRRLAFADWASGEIRLGRLAPARGAP
ncbi:MAG: PD40 domain-containing protein [Deltaproteobacteria bacterium]|nr:PD40 domain-containing protein [Deltaproteobacteria bacterium]